MKEFVSALGSLRLTVALLAASILLVFMGTIAQVNMGIWEVVDGYFRCWIAWIYGIPYPGGWLLGAALVVNLLMAHVVKIRVQADGKRLAFGCLATAAGALLVWFIVSRVFEADSSEGTIAPFWRVTLQLLEGGGAALVLWLGCGLLFGKKAGIVLVHAGVVLLMVGELLTGLVAEEAQMTIREGKTVRYVEDTRAVELAVIDPSDPAFDDVVVIPEGRLFAGGTIPLEGFPFEAEVAPGNVLKQAYLHRAGEDLENPATAGTGRDWMASDKPQKGQECGASAYVTFRERNGGKPIGTWLATVLFTLNRIPQVVPVGGKIYHVYLRYKRTYKPYAIHLSDFRFERHPGTNTPKDFSSYIRLIDEERDLERDVRIWMNNPLRYRGDTLYQSSFTPDEKGTILQVVTNPGWMIPYVACMISALGLLVQFGAHLLGFLHRRGAA